MFSGFKAGIGVLLGHTGGYIAGFVLAGLIYWLLVGRLGKKMWAELLAMALGAIWCGALFALRRKRGRLLPGGGGPAGAFRGAGVQNRQRGAE